LTVNAFSNFRWDGIILAGNGVGINRSLILAPSIEGALIVGLDPGVSQPSYTVGIGGSGSVEVSNHSCYIAQANRVLAYLELIDNSRWEF
jgi:hypothetical protein